MSDQELRPATPDDVDDMALVLADAFHDDPVFTWMFPDPATRPRRLEAMFTLIGRHLYVGQGECLVGQHAASYWEPPGAPDSAELWGDHAEELVTAMEGEVERLGALGAAMAAFHPDEPCWYLAVLGVRSSAQGRGLGGALLARKLEQIDAAGVASR
jgi:ribosomal protein S18 acetylase RimI-like enzyme